MIIRDNGMVGIGMTPDYNLDVTGSSRVSGDLYAWSFQQISDIRLKKNIKKLSGSLEKIKRLNGYSYNWIDESKATDLQIGIISQEVEKVFPEMVLTDIDGNKTVSYGNLVAPMIEGMKELDEKNIDLQNQNDELEKRIETLEEIILEIGTK
jgi:hypothetical protein